MGARSGHKVGQFGTNPIIRDLLMSDLVQYYCRAKKKLPRCDPLKKEYQIITFGANLTDFWPDSAILIQTS